MIKKTVGGIRMEAVDKDDFLKTFCDEEKQGRHLLSGACRVEGKWSCLCVCLSFDFLFGWLVSGRRNLSTITVREQGPVVKLKRVGDSVKMTEHSFRAGRSSNRESTAV